MEFEEKKYFASLNLINPGILLILIACINCYQNTMYADHTILTKGKYKFTALCRVPPEYLLNLYTKKNKADPDLYDYVEKNLLLIKARATGVLKIPELDMTCNKIVYFSEKVAKDELKRIREMDNDHKIPIRSYLCEVCGGFHLTSKSFY